MNTLREAITAILLIFFTFLFVFSWAYRWDVHDEMGIGFVWLFMVLVIIANDREIK